MADHRGQWFEIHQLANFCEHSPALLLKELHIITFDVVNCTIFLTKGSIFLAQHDQRVHDQRNQWKFRIMPFFCLLKGFFFVENHTPHYHCGTKHRNLNAVRRGLEWYFFWPFPTPKPSHTPRIHSPVALQAQVSNLLLGTFLAHIGGMTRYLVLQAHPVDEGNYMLYI